MDEQELRKEAVRRVAEARIGRITDRFGPTAREIVVDRFYQDAEVRRL